MDLTELAKDLDPCHAEFNGLLGHRPFALVFAVLEAEAKPANDLITPAPVSRQFRRDTFLSKTLEARLDLPGLLVE